MSQEEFLQKLNGLFKKILVSVVAGLFLMIIGGGWTMAKVFNVKGKADKVYVDKFYNDIRVIMENRTLVLEQLVKAQKESNEKDVEMLNKRLDELDRQWSEHLQYHIERTRGETSNL